MSKWYLVRHGETEWNVERRLQGQTDVPIHAGGRAAAERTAQRLASVSFSAVYSSDLNSTIETADIILAAQGTGTGAGSRPGPRSRARSLAT